jgi:hypothetical protein
VTVLMAAAVEDTDSALHASCVTLVTLRTAGARLLARAQAAGRARTDMDGTDLFALVAALAWLGDQPSPAPRADHLFDVVASAILTNPASTDTGRTSPRARSRHLARGDQRSRPRLHVVREADAFAAGLHDIGLRDIGTRLHAAASLVVPDLAGPGETADNMVTSRARVPRPAPAAFINLRVLQPEHQQEHWRRGIEAAAIYARTHGT